MKYNKKILQLLYGQIEEEQNKLEDEKFKQQFLFVCKQEYISQMEIIAAIMNTIYHLLMSNQLSRALRYVVILSATINNLKQNVDQECKIKSADFFHCQWCT